MHPWVSRNKNIVIVTGLKLILQSELSVGWVDARVGLGWVGSWVWNGRCAKKIHVVYICNFVLCRVSTGKFVLWKLAVGASLHHRDCQPRKLIQLNLFVGVACSPNMTVMLVILWVFAVLRCASGWRWWHDEHKLIFLRQASVVVRCMWVRLGMGWLGQLFGGLRWVGSMKIDPRTTLITVYPSNCNCTCVRVIDIFNC